MQTTLLSSPSLLLPLARRTALQQQWCITKHTGTSSLNTLDYIPLRKKAGHSLLLNSDPSSADDTRETISIFTFMQIAIESSKQKGFRQPFLAHALYFCGKYRFVFFPWHFSIFLCIFLYTNKRTRGVWQYIWANLEKCNKRQTFHEMACAATHSPEPQMKAKDIDIFVGRTWHFEWDFTGKIKVQ